KHVCYFDDFGNEVINNTLTNNGFFANPGNVDLAEISNPESPGNCWHANEDKGQPLGEPTSEPKLIQRPPHSECGIPDPVNRWPARSAPRSPATRSSSRKWSNARAARA